MCFWTTFNYSCGHRVIREEVCTIQQKQSNPSFPHSVQCQLVDIDLGLDKSCTSCDAGKTQPILSHDDRNTLPSQPKKKTLDTLTKEIFKRKLPPLPGTLSSGISNLVKGKREFKIWKGEPEDTRLECERLAALGKNPFPAIVPINGRVKDKCPESMGGSSCTWVTAPVYWQEEYKQHCLKNKYFPLQLQAALPDHPSSCEEPSPGQVSATTQPKEVELFLNRPNQARNSGTPDCLVPGTTRRPTPHQFLELAANVSKCLPPQLPQHERISPLNFEGTILEGLAAIDL